ncbi:MAG: hypothetical protein AB1403_16950 [Candidatus Riflebacteria bacterium]
MENLSQSGCNTGKWFWVCLAAFLLLVLVFFKNAWVSDDAYINFRAIEQLFAGNGPNWNHHERVQVYTSPLWFWMLSAFRLISPDHFFNSIIMSFVLFLLLAWLMFRQLSLLQASLAFLLLLASNSFMDFTTSGLENILVALLLAVSLSFLEKAGESSSSAGLTLAIAGLALLPVSRHDAVAIAFPLMLIVLTKHCSSNSSRLKTAMLMFAPLIVWSCFSLVYYGALFPNTAYAKIMTGIPRWAMVNQGLKYLLVTLQQDPITVFAIFAAIFTGFRSPKVVSKAAAAGIVLNLLYVLWVGGDFMRGRFLSASYLVAIFVLVWQFESAEESLCSKGLCRGTVLIYLVYLLAFPSTPLNTGLNYSNFNIDHGIADERGYYFDVCSLYSYLYSKPGDIFPDFEWSHIGRQIAESKVGYLENDFNGMLGYWAGTRPIIIDRLALGDPLLARLPLKKDSEWRIGHFKRDVPEEYRRSIETGQNHFSDPGLKELYELIVFATREKELLSLKRLIAILRLNLKLYRV